MRRPSPRYPWHDNDLSAVLLRTAFGPSATADMIDAVRRMSADMATASLIEAGNALAAHDVRQVLPFVDRPTTVVVGDADRITPPGHARELAELIPGATLVELEGVGHQIMQESPVALAGTAPAPGRRDHLTIVGPTCFEDDVLGDFVADGRDYPVGAPIVVGAVSRYAAAWNQGFSGVAPAAVVFRTERGISTS